MADDERKTKRSRVRKGPYNQYLRDNNPFKTAPKAFRTEGKQDSATDPSPSSNPLHADEAVTDLQSNSAQECVGITSDQDYEGADDSNIGEHLITDKHKDGNNFNMEFMKDIVEQRKLINDFVEEEYLNSDFPEEYEMQHNIPVFPHEYEDIDCDSGEVLHTDMHSNSSKDSHEANETVHPHTSLTVGASMLLIMSFALKHSLTGEGLSDLLSLVDLHCPSENKIPKTLGQFRKWFADIKNPLVFHKYCTFCHMYLAENEVNEICPNEKCQAKLTDESISQFIEIPIGTQIKTLFSRPSFLQDISYRFSRKKKQPNTIEDIYDGEIYRNLSENNGVLNQPYNLSLLWNTDGIPCFKSSKMSLWPLLFQINELPYSKRSDPDNMILGGLWYGPKKPSIMCFTEPFLQNLQDLEENGIDIIDSVGVIHTCKVFVIGGSADMPARRLLCNTIQFNGKFGCCKCLQPGETFKTGKGGHCHIFPFESTCPDGPVRTHAGIMNDSIAAVENGKPQNGVKGPNFLQCLKYYDLAKGTCIDYMHGVLLGVAKLLLTLWFSSEHNNEIFSLSHFVDVVDAKLVNIKPPNSIKRTPRSIKEHVKYWKASELRSWLLYYSAPILLNIQDQEYLKHYLLFVNAVFILLQSSITLEDLKRAEEDILQFVSMFNVFYGDRYMTCNLHQLIHLPQLVFDMGPLWAYSCFPFENYNGILLKLFHGTQHIDLQIGQTVSLMQRLPELQYKHLKPNSLEMELFQSMKGVSQKTDKLLESNISAMGALKKTKISQADHKILSSFLEQDLTDYVTFNRIKIGNDIIHSRNYQRCSVRNSYTIAFKQENEDTLNIGQIEYYLQLQHCITHNCTTSRCHCAPLHVAVVRHFRNEDSGLLSDLRHVFTVTSEPKRITFSIVLLKNILFKCVLIDIKDSKLSYVCKMPNLLERD